jgi:hypothetical protein
VHEAAQLLGAWGIWTGDEESLAFRPEQHVGSAELRALTRLPAWAKERLEGRLTGWLPRWSTLERGEIAEAVYAALCV